MTITITAFPGRYIQGPGVLKNAGMEIIKYGKRCLMVIDPFVVDNIWPAYSHCFSELEIETYVFGGECCEAEISKVVQRADQDSISVIIGMGGGKTIDTAKAAADQIGLPVIIVPTAASSDAPCSSVAVIYEPEGEFKRAIKTRSNPQAVFMDTEIIAKAPAKLLLAGMGDALATWFEADTVWTTHSSNILGSPSSRTAHYLAHLCYETIVEYGVLAKQASEAGCITPALEYVVEANTLLSGIGFESGGLGAPHAIHNGLSILPGSHHALHGEKVAFGVLATLFMNDKGPDLINKLYDLYKQLGLPTTLEALGLGSITSAELMTVGEATCMPGSNIHHEPIDVSPEKVRDALLMADYFGKHK